ncbi:MAG: tetratricopeptide repeat protein, partial [Thermoplasmata archaeon]|nr:tetratricopeptide repeat protein [Thermoplasmata archaeon]
MGSNLSDELREIMQSELGDMGKFILSKQCKNLEIDPECVMPGDLPKLANALSTTMKMFGTDKSRKLYEKVLKLRNLDTIVEEETDKSKKLDDLINLAMAKSNAGKWDDASSDYQDALELANLLDDVEKLATIKRALGNLALRKG